MLSVCFQSGDDRLVTCRRLPHLHAYFRAYGEEKVHPAAQFDEAQVFVDVAVFAFLGVSHDAACYGTGNLAAEDVRPVRRCDDGIGVLVRLAWLWEPSLVVVTLKIIH